MLRLWQVMVTFPVVVYIFMKREYKDSDPDWNRNRVISDGRLWQINDFLQLIGLPDAEICSIQKNRKMKSTINTGLILSGALLINMPGFSQTTANQPVNNQSVNNHSVTNQSTSNQSVTESKTAIKMDKNQMLTTNQTPAANKATVRRLYDDILNTGKFELLNQIVSDTYEGPRGIKGPAGFAAAIKPVRTAFPDIKWTIEDLIAEGDEVMIRWSWKGTNTVSFDGFPVSNKTVTHHAISIFQFDGDKISKAWMQADRLGFYQQIGVIAPDITTAPVRN